MVRLVIGYQHVVSSIVNFLGSWTTYEPLLLVLQTNKLIRNVYRVAFLRHAKCT